MLLCCLSKDGWNHYGDNLFDRLAGLCENLPKTFSCVLLDSRSGFVFGLDDNRLSTGVADDDVGMLPSLVLQHAGLLCGDALAPTGVLSAQDPREVVIECWLTCAGHCRSISLSEQMCAPAPRPRKPCIVRSGQRMAGPLAGVRVLDLSREVAGAYATKLLGDYGADVLKLEPPGGDPLRRFGPFPRDEPHPERSGLFLHLNTNKRSRVLDVTDPANAAAVRALAAEADIVVEDFAPGDPDSWGWGWETLAAARDDLVLLSITPFGQTGPYRRYRASEVTLQGFGGPMHMTGHASLGPLKHAGHFAGYHAGIIAAYAATLVRLRVEAGGGGDWVDVSMAECQASSRDRRSTALLAASYAGVGGGRGATGLRVAAGVRPCADGFVNIMGAGPRLHALLHLIDREDLLDHPDINAPMSLMPPALAEEIENAYRAWLAGRTKREIIPLAQGHHLPCGALQTTQDLLEDPHFLERGVWESIDHPETARLDYPGRPFVLSATPRPLARRAPLLGEHAAGEPFAPRPAPTPPARPLPLGRLPLEGIRVAEVTVVWAGTHVSQLLADWGAEVVRVEPVNRIQPSTRGAEVSLTGEQARRLAEQGQPLSAYPDFDPRDDPWNRNPGFNVGARNKRSMTCDIMAPEGQETIRRLVARSDVFIENNVPETMAKAGISYEALREVNPELVMLRMPAFGLSGPYRDYRGFGMHAEAMVGHTLLRGYPDAGPELTGDVLAADAIAGVHGALAAVMALRHRQRTGEGQQIEMALAESFLPVLGQFLLDCGMNGRVAAALGNTHPWNAPHGPYPTRGDDQWIAIDVATDEEFAALCHVLGGEGLAAEARFATAEARREHRAALDEAVAALTATRHKMELFHALQARDVCAAPLLDGVDAQADPHLNSRGFFEDVYQPGVGTHRYPGMNFKLANTPNAIRLPAPALGEHNDWAYLDLLGYTRPELDAIIASGQAGARYPAALLPSSGG